MEIPLQTAAAKSTGLLLPPVPAWRLVPWERQVFDISHHSPSFLLLKISTRWVQPTGGSPCFYPASTCGKEALPWNGTAENTGTPIMLVLASIAGIYAKRGKMNRPGADGPPQPVNTLVLKQRCHSERSTPVSLPPGPDCSSQNLSGRRSRPKNREFQIPLQRIWFYLQQSVKKFKPKGALKTMQVVVKGMWEEPDESLEM